MLLNSIELMTDQDKLTWVALGVFLRHVGCENLIVEAAGFNPTSFEKLHIYTNVQNSKNTMKHYCFHLFFYFINFSIFYEAISVKPVVRSSHPL